MKTAKTFEKIEVTVKRWFNKRFRWTRHSLRITIDDNPIREVFYGIGGGDCYMSTLLRVLQSKGHYTQNEGNNIPSRLVNDYCDLLNDCYDIHNRVSIKVFDVDRKKDL